MTNVRTYQELWTTAPAALRVIRTNYSHHNGKLAQLPVRLTSFPPVSVAALFFLCFFLHMSIHHAHFKRLAFQFCTQWSVPFTLKLVPMCLQSSSILTCSSALQIFSPQSSQDVQLHFCAAVAGKSISVLIILATSPVYSLLKTEPLCWEQPGPWCIRVLGCRQTKLNPFHRGEGWKGFPRHGKRQK